MAVLSGEQVAQIAYQAGFRGDVLVKMVGIAKRESGWNSTANRADADWGLFQINDSANLAQLRQAGIVNSEQDLLDPVKNAQAAFYLYNVGGQSLRPWNGSAQGWTTTGDPMYGVNIGAAQTAVTNAQSQGLIGQSYSGGAVSPGGSMPATDNPAAASGPMTLPPDAKLYNNGMAVIAVFDIGGVKIGYDVNWFDGSVSFDSNAVEHLSADAYNQLGVVQAGNAEELRGLSTQYGSYKDFFDGILGQVMGYNNPARNDPEVLKVIAEFAGRPDMTPAELQNRLQATGWYQQRTESELKWNSISDAERTKQTDETAAKMVQTWFQFTGEAIAADDPRIGNYLGDVASGKMGYGAWTENIVKKAATDNGESPWSRQKRDEEEAQRQRGVDVENTAGRVRELARKWGVQYADSTFQDWARQIAENKMSDDDVLNLIKDQAAVLYPWKPRDLDTTTAATPWMQTYERLMEKTGDLTEPKIQAALAAGQPAWEFEQSLKKSSQWLETKNGRDSMYSTVAEAGRRMGFE